ncbi:unnamed protein product [Pleuronectes platessa]|uniref:Uncharacterized protein n=1 Tax=Pleuronectes platessa TaxID=8262 RepID=A0A9N7YI87_PLEPL|nr:unnamed protein product [Pleuronectes platessa]
MRCTAAITGSNTLLVCCAASDEPQNVSPASTPVMVSELVPVISALQATTGIPLSSLYTECPNSGAPGLCRPRRSD